MARVRETRSGGGGRRGALQSAELLVCLPVLLALLFGLGEVALLWSANHQLQAAAQAACRRASLPAASEFARHEEARRVAEEVLAHRKYLEAYEFLLAVEGESVAVELRLPMTAASPDLLQVIGLSIAGRELTARSTMRLE